MSKAKTPPSAFTTSNLSFHSIHALARALQLSLGHSPMHRSCNRLLTVSGPKNINSVYLKPNS